VPKWPESGNQFPHKIPLQDISGLLAATLARCKRHKQTLLGASEEVNSAMQSSLRTDERTVVLSRYTQPGSDVQLLLKRMKLQLPPEPPPKITAPKLPDPTPL